MKSSPSVPNSWDLSSQSEGLRVRATRRLFWTSDTPGACQAAVVDFIRLIPVVDFSLEDHARPFRADIDASGFEPHPAHKRFTNLALDLTGLGSASAMTRILFVTPSTPVRD